MSGDLFRIVYCSRCALSPDTPVPLEDILAASRRNNRAADVTGALLYAGGKFAQMLEGNRYAVQRTFERIKGDARHDHVVLLQAHPIELRISGDWEMALAKPADPEAANAILRAAMLRPGEAVAAQLAELLSELVRRDERLPA